MLRQAENLGNSSGIEVSCDVPCRILEGSNWKLILEHTENSIFFIDEENVFVHTVEFASCVKDSGNYFVLITRENLYGLPYSVEEIYGIRTSGRYGTLKQSYHEFYRIYGTDTYEDKVSSEIIITEDISRCIRSILSFKIFRCIQIKSLWRIPILDMNFLMRSAKKIIFCAKVQGESPIFSQSFNLLAKKRFAL